MIDLDLETVNFLNNSGNIEVCIYNQYLNIKRKTNGITTFNQYESLYPDLRNRIRIEVRRRIRRTPMSLNDFANFDILGEYGKKHRKFLLDNLFSKVKLEEIREEAIYELDITYKEYIIFYGRMNYVACLNINKDKIFDYSIVREVLRKNIPNQKTLESAITSVREELNIRFSNSFKCFDMIEEMRKCIKNYRFNYSEISPHEIVSENVEVQEVCLHDNRSIFDEELSN